MARQLLIIAAVFLALGAFMLGRQPGTPLKAFVPATEDEANLILLIQRFHKARQDKELKIYLACLSGRGSFMFAGGPMLSKPELARALPGFWAGLAAGDLTAMAFSRESLNGNFLEGDLFDPEIVVQGTRARASLRFATPRSGWQTRLFLVFEKEAAGWRITRLAWDMG